MNELSKAIAAITHGESDPSYSAGFSDARSIAVNLSNTNIDFNKVKLTSWTDIENYGEKFCDAFNAGVSACISISESHYKVSGQ